MVGNRATVTPPLLLVLGAFRWISIGGFVFFGAYETSRKMITRVMK